MMPSYYIEVLIGGSHFSEAPGEEPALGVGGGQVQRFGEAGGGFGPPAEAQQQVGPGGGQQVVPGQLAGSSTARTRASPAAGPSAMATATARFSSTTGEGTSRTSSP